MIAKLGGRRFILSVMTLIICSVLLWFGKLTDPSYALIVMGTVGALIAAHTVQNIKAPPA